MADITIDERETAFLAAQSIEARLTGPELNLRLDLSDDWDELREITSNVPSPLGLSESFSRPHEDAFWMKLSHGETVVGLRAVDVYKTRSFRRDIESWRRFRRLPPRDWRRIDVENPELLDSIRGIIGFGGAVWTHPSWQNKGLATALSMITRYLLVGYHDADFFVGLVEGELKAKGFGVDQLKMSGGASIINGHYPGRGKDMNVSVIYKSCREILLEAAQTILSHESAERLSASG